VSTRIQAPPSLRGYAYLLSVIQRCAALPWRWSIRQSMLVLGGGDGRHPAPRNSRILALHPQARPQVVHGSGHLFVLQQAREVAPFIEEFSASERPVRRISQPRSGSCV
jgi:pimeloyl-ACP methyl ester carboxylesterase